MHYIIYKTTNLINGKFYIGKHQTNDLNDGYVGSGKLLKRAIKKYGLDQFKTEIIETCSTEAHMNLAEKVYVVIDQEVSYNLCPGGRGGFGYINNNIDLIERNRQINSRKDYKEIGRKISLVSKGKSKPLSPEKKQKMSMLRSELNRLCNPMQGKKHTEESRLKMSEKASGCNGSQFGTCWITNGKINKKIKKEDVDLWAEQGYHKGRIMGC